MNTQTNHTPNTTRRALIDPVIMSAMTGVGIGLGFAAAFVFAALLDVHFGLPLAIALPAAMLLAIGAAIIMTRRRQRSVKD